MCNCINEVNKKLVEHNTKLETNLMIGSNPTFVVAIGTSKLDKTNRKRPLVVLASFCCFCGSGLVPDKLTHHEENADRLLVESAGGKGE